MSRVTLALAGAAMAVPSMLLGQPCPVIRQNDDVRVEVSSGSWLIDLFFADPEDRTLDVRLIGVYADTAYIDDAGSELAVPLEEVYRWEKLCRDDPVWDGLVTGAAIGLAAALTVDLMLTSVITAYTASEGFWTTGARPYVVLGLSGAVIGGGWDWITPAWVEATLGRQAYLGEPYQRAPAPPPLLDGSGAVVGGLFGGSVGLVAGILSGPSLFEGGESCGGDGSPETCEPITKGEARAAGALLFGLGGAVVGAFIGSRIVPAEPAELSISFGPVMSPAGPGTAWGASASIPWSPTR
jgi:hypothetical protein